MDIEKARKLKLDLQENVSGLLEDFEEATGLTVKSVQITSIAATTFTSRRGRTVLSIDIVAGL